MRVRDVLSHIGPAATVLTAPHRLDAQVTWPHVTDLADPGPYLRGGELILTNGLWASDPAASARFVAALADHDVAALGLALFPGQPLPPGLQEECEARGVLLVLLPDVPFRSISETIMASVVEERRESDTHHDPAARALAERVGRGDGPVALTSVLEEMTGRPCALLLRDGTLFGALQLQAEEVRAVWRTTFVCGDSRGGLVDVPDITQPLTLAVLAVGPEPSETDGSDTTAAVVWRGRPHGLGDTATAAIRLIGQQAGVALEPHFAAARSGCAAHNSAAGELLAAQYASVPTTAAATAAAAQRLWGSSDIPELLTVLAVLAPNHRDLTRDALEVVVRAAGLGEAVVVAPSSADVWAVVATGHPDHAAATAETVCTSLRDMLGNDILVGVADGASTDGVARLMLRARHARIFAGVTRVQQGWADARSAGSHLLVLAAGGPQVLDTLHHAILAPIDEYDRAHGTDLAKTLAAFLDANCSWQRTADDLILHVNSLRYRISRIEELTGRSLTSMTDRVDLYLAVQARRHATSLATGHDTVR